MSEAERIRTQQRRRRSIVIALVLAAFILVIYGVSIVRMGG
ncbi:MAG: hypothetical protein OXU19_00695 [bacterium]|nr:hypothetical protein [bacterium]